MTDFLKQADAVKLIHGRFNMLYNDFGAKDPTHDIIIESLAVLNHRLILNDEFKGVFKERRLGLNKN